MSHLGARLKAHRTALGWSLSEASRQSGLARSYLYQLERGESQPTVSKAVQLATAYGLSLEELVGYKSVSLVICPTCSGKGTVAQEQA